MTRCVSYKSRWRVSRPVRLPSDSLLCRFPIDFDGCFGVEAWLCVDMAKLDRLKSILCVGVAVSLDIKY